MKVYLLTAHWEQKIGEKSPTLTCLRATEKSSISGSQSHRSNHLHANQLFSAACQKQNKHFLYKHTHLEFAQLCWDLDWNCLLLSDETKIDLLRGKQSRSVWRIVMLWVCLLYKGNRCTVYDTMSSLKCYRILNKKNAFCTKFRKC